MYRTWIDGIGFSIKDENLGVIKIEHIGQTLKVCYPCSSNFTCSPYIIDFPPGTFFIQVFGASGGYAMNAGVKYRGGYGGVSEGVYQIDHSQRVYLFIGGSGENVISTESLKGGFNGGGSSYGTSGGGGGCTDIRTSENISLDTRIVVAGGGGGSRMNGLIGGNGGGENGSKGQYGGSNIPCYGSNDGCIGESGEKILKGSLGYGADALENWGYGFGSGGGGGGYYGGGSAGNAAGSGGSGFIGSLISYHHYSPTTSYSENDGNGYAIITIIDSRSSYIKCSFFQDSFCFNTLAIFSFIVVDK